MKSLALFPETFQKTQAALNLAQKIKEKALPFATKRLPLQQISRTMLIFNSIENNAMDLQTPEVDRELSRYANLLAIKGMTASYDYNSKGFLMVKDKPLSGKIQKLSLHLRSQPVEKVDHPVLRQSLYFHELKNIDQLVEIKYPRNSPRFVKEIYRKNTQNQLLDNKNPLGLPLQAPPLEFILQINETFGVELHCRYGNINIQSIRMLKHNIQGSNPSALKCDYMLNGMNIPRIVQRTLYNLIKEEMEFDEPELLILHKMAYIGGRVQQLELLFNLLDFYAAAIDKL